MCTQTVLMTTFLVNCLFASIPNLCFLLDEAKICLVLHELRLPQTSDLSSFVHFICI